MGKLFFENSKSDRANSDTIPDDQYDSIYISLYEGYKKNDGI